MEYTYEIIEHESRIICIKRMDEDGNESFIPTDPNNSDYQAYLLSLEVTDGD